MKQSTALLTSSTGFPEQAATSTNALARAATLTGNSTAVPVLPREFLKLDELDFLTEPERRLYSRLVTRTFVNVYGLVQRHIDIGDQDGTSLDTGLRVIAADREAGMPDGYVFIGAAKDLGGTLLRKPAWALRGLALALDAIAEVYRQVSGANEPAAIEHWNGWFAVPTPESVPRNSLLIKAWAQEDGKLDPAAHDDAVDELVDVLVAIDDLLRGQVKHDVQYFVNNTFREYTYAEASYIEQVMLRAYRYQFFVAGLQSASFSEVLDELTTNAQKARICNAVQPLVASQTH